MKSIKMLKKPLNFIFMLAILMGSGRVFAFDRDPETFRDNINRFNVDILENQGNQDDIVELYRNNYQDSLGYMLRSIESARSWAVNRVERARLAHERCRYISRRVISLSGQGLDPATAPLALEGNPQAQLDADDVQVIEDFDVNRNRISRSENLRGVTERQLRRANRLLNDIRTLEEEARDALGTYDRDFLTEYDPQEQAPEHGSRGVNTILNYMRDRLRDANEHAFNISLASQNAVRANRQMWNFYLESYPDDLPGAVAEDEEESEEEDEEESEGEGE